MCLQSKIDSVVGGRFDAVASSPDWLALAGYLHRRWKVPAAVEVEDVAQELRCWAWVAFTSWDGRGSAGAFVMQRAIWRTIDWISAQRGALRHRSTAPSRVPSRLPDTFELPDVDCAGWIERRVDLGRRLASQSADVRWLVQVFVHSSGDLRVASRVVRSDPRCKRLKITSHASAVAALLSAVREAVAA